jgi:two-component system sensor histidine kinase ChvG
VIGRDRVVRWIRRLHPSRIAFRLLAFNLLVVFLPVAGILYLDVYERELLAEQERGMVLEARGIAAGLAGAADLSVDAKRVVGLVANQGSRIRIFSAEGATLADSASTPVPAATAAAAVDAGDEVRSTVLYRIAAWFVRVGSRLRGSARSEYESAAVESGPPREVRAALAGEYGASTRPTPGQRSMTLTSAVPIRNGGTIIGAVTASQTTYRTLNALYRIRIRLFRIILLSLGLAVVLSVVVAGTVVRPIDRLRVAAADVSSRLGGLTTPFAEVRRKDEVGDLARALHDLTHRLDAHIRQVEAFAGDVAHEFRNPLAAIRIAAETVSTTDDPVVRVLFLTRLIGDVDRLERLVVGVRDLAVLDAEIAQEPPSQTDLRAVVSSVVDGVRLAGPASVTLTDTTSGPLFVGGHADRLAQVFENIVGNAQGLSTKDAAVDVTLSSAPGMATVTVADRGPGIPAGHEHRIFERFFTYRPNEPAGRREHAGLGLAIAKAIIEGYGGRISAQNREGGGSVFTVTLAKNLVSLN